MRASDVVRRRGAGVSRDRGNRAAEAAPPPPQPEVTRPPADNDAGAASAGPGGDPAEPEFLRDGSALQARRAARLGDRRGSSRSSIAAWWSSRSTEGACICSWRLLQSDPGERRVQRVPRDGRRRAGADSTPSRSGARPTSSTRRRRARSRTHLVGHAGRRTDASRRRPNACTLPAQPPRAAVSRAETARRRAQRRSRRHRRSRRRRRLRFRRQAPRRADRSGTARAEHGHVQDRRLQRQDGRVHVADRSRLEHQSRHLVLADGRARSRRRQQGRSLPAHRALRGDARADARSDRSRSCSTVRSTSASTTARPARRSTRSTGSSVDRSPTGPIDRATARAGTCSASPISTARRRACSWSAAPTD